MGWIILTLLGLLGACGSGITTPGTAALCNSSLTFDKDISPIISAQGSGHCASCHAGRFDSKAGIQSNRSKVYKKVDSGSMPTDNRGFKDSADGKTFLGWAACATLK